MILGDALLFQSVHEHEVRIQDVNQHQVGPVGGDHGLHLRQQHLEAERVAQVGQLVAARVQLVHQLPRLRAVVNPQPADVFDPRGD